MSILLEVKNLSKYYPIKKGIWQSFRSREEAWFKAVDDVSFNLDRGKVLVIAGQSGSGKSTVARLVMGATLPTSGKIFFDGADISQFKGKRLKEFRSRVHMVYQDPYSSLDPRMKVIDIIKEPLDIHDRHSSRQQKEDRVMEALNDVRLESSLAAELPQSLSGGQRQRVALARAIVLQPELIVADEPVSMLDVSVRAEILNLMMGLKDKLQSAFIYITHDLSTARYVGDSIIIMRDGKIVEKGQIDDVLLSPVEAYTKELINAIPNLSTSHDQH